jgi:hypothetical protein
MLRLAVLLLFVPFALPQVFHSPKPVAPKDFAVMAWGDSPSDPAQLEGMREAGLNISGFCRVEDLERVRAAGLTCFVSDPTIENYDPLHLPLDAELRRHVAELKKEVGDNPAALGFFLRDEPDVPSMPGLGKLAAMVREIMPDKWPYVNLFPYRVSRTGSAPKITIRTFGCW